LKMIFDTHAAVESYEASEKFFSCMMEEHSSVSEHVLRMSEYFKHLNQVGVRLPNKVVIDRVL